MTSLLPTISSSSINQAIGDALIAASVRLLPSAQSRRAYTSRLRAFVQWSSAQSPSPSPPLPFTRLTIERYIGELITTGRGPSSRNQSIAAIKKLAQTAVAHHALDPQTALDICAIKSNPQKGVRTGNWLTKDDCIRLLDPLPDTPIKHTMGKFAQYEQRDRAILALLLGCGLRRAEGADLTWDKLQQRDNRWVITDMHGKGDRVRTIPIPSWSVRLLKDWSVNGLKGVVWGTEPSRVLRSFNNEGKVNGALSANAIWEIVSRRAEGRGLKVAPHDLRRTFAKLSRKGGAKIEQIQMALGHASIQTTERYLGTALDLGEAACDKMGIE